MSFRDSHEMILIVIISAGACTKHSKNPSVEPKRATNVMSFRTQPSFSDTEYFKQLTGRRLNIILVLPYSVTTDVTFDYTF